MKKPIVKADELDAQYQAIFGDVSSIIDAARRSYPFSERRHDRCVLDDRAAHRGV